MMDGTWMEGRDDDDGDRYDIVREVVAGVQG